MNIKWWLMTSSFPDLNWAKQTLFDNGTSQVLDCDGQPHKFKTEKLARNWLLEDEFTAYENLDVEDEREYKISISKIHPPISDKAFYAKNT